MRPRLPSPACLPSSDRSGSEQSGSLSHDSMYSALTSAAASILRIQSCNLHSYVLSHLFDRIVHNVGLNVYQNADLSAACECRKQRNRLPRQPAANLLMFMFSPMTAICPARASFTVLDGIDFPCLCQESIDICCGSVHSLLSNLLLRSSGTSRSLQRSLSQQFTSTTTAFLHHR